MLRLVSWTYTIGILIVAVLLHQSGVWQPLVASCSPNSSFSTSFSTSTSSEEDPDRMPLSIPITIHPETTQLHLIVLQHGLAGNHLELDYLKQALELEAIASLRKDKQSASASASFDTRTSTTQIVVYSAKENEGRTWDGIAAGGTRLAQEINELVDPIRRRILEQGQYETDASNNNSDTTLSISLSLVGNSLGGLYGRHALKYIDWTNITPLVFCTTVTPHLGIHQHTYIPLFRGLEVLVGHSMQKTGLDLFRLTFLLDELVSDSQFMDPLSKFQSRIAVANAFGTDFQVPTASAAFLAKLGDPTHHVLPDEHGDSFLTLMVQTKTQPQPPTTGGGLPLSPPSDTNMLSLETHAQRLDALGWKKLFVDMRPHLPSLPCRTKQLEGGPRASYSSQDLQDTICGVEYQFPWGHSLLTANSKNPVYRWLNQAGKPVMDRLAREILNEILLKK
jgi:hypothetical protein